MAMATKLATISPGIPESPSNDCTVFDLDKFIHEVLNYWDLNYCDPRNTMVYEKYLDYQDFDYWNSIVTDLEYKGTFLDQVIPIIEDYL